MAGMGRRAIGAMALICAVCVVGFGAATADAHQTVTRAYPVTQGAMCEGDSGAAFLFPRTAHVRQSNVPFCTTGTVVTRFHGSRAAGCASRGVCGYRGVITWRPGGGELLTAVRAGHGLATMRTATLLGGSGHATVVVRRSAGGRLRGTCRQRVSGLDSTSTTTPVRRGIGRIELSRPGGNDMWRTRCAGPLQADLPAVPGLRVPIQLALRGVVHTTSATTRSFSRDGWAGSVTTQLKVVAGPPGPKPPNPPGSTGHRVREVRVIYRVAVPTGSVAIAYAHGAKGCAAVDACGLRGMARLRPVAGAQTGVFVRSAIGPTDRPKLDFLTALGLATGGDTQGILASGGQIGPSRVRVSVTTTQGATRCRGVGAGNVGLTEFGANSVTEHSWGPTDPLRTICPGPTLGLQSLGVTALQAGELNAAHATLALTTASTIHQDGYTLQVHPHLSIALTRTSVTDHVMLRAGR
jgi:hypothetical protein